VPPERGKSWVMQGSIRPFEHPELVRQMLFQQPPVGRQDHRSGLNARKTPILASIVGPPCSATNISGWIALYHSAVAAFVFCQDADRTASEGRLGQHRRSVDPVEPVAVRLASSQHYATKMGRVEICCVK
jgi:hypothetical protein